MIEMRDVRFGYGRGTPLFSALDFSVSPGGVVGLLGKNGAGKTTLLKIGAGLLFAEAGTAELFGVPAAKRVPDALARLAFIPEQFEVPAMRLREYVEYHSAYYPRFDTELMERYLQRFEIEGNKRLTHLSFGQQKKVLLSFALASMAELVILDEPTNGLDIPSKQVFRRLIVEAADDRRAVVISTHQVRDVENLIDPVVVLDNGTVVFEASFGTIQSRLEMRRFDSEVAARRAGAFAMESRLGSTVALVPSSGTRDTSTGIGSRTGDADQAGEDQAGDGGRTGDGGQVGDGYWTGDGGESLGDDIDLELLFQAAVTSPREMMQLCGGER
ncbi:MAG: ATP-binding cassette domain-containing protein [Alkalispirochaeta sp.]